MAKLPVVSGRQASSVFQSFGWHVDRQSASHIVLVKPGVPVTLSVPDHREVAKGTLRNLISSAGLTVDEFVDGLKRL
jgi:predicted RNA binding protein YcfA (HicA-like mRNA interferase family)